MPHAGRIPPRAARPCSSATRRDCTKTVGRLGQSRSVFWNKPYASSRSPFRRRASARLAWATQLSFVTLFAWRNSVSSLSQKPSCLHVSPESTTITSIDAAPSARGPMRRPLSRSGRLPGDHYEYPDQRKIGVPVRYRLRSHLHQSDNGNQRPYEPEPADCKPGRLPESQQDKDSDQDEKEERHPTDCHTGKAAPGCG